MPKNNQIEDIEEFNEEMKHRIHFSADDANNASTAVKAAARLKKLGYTVTGKGGVGHRRILDVTSPSASHSARLHKMFGKNTKRYDTGVSDVNEEDEYQFEFNAKVEDIEESIASETLKADSRSDDSNPKSKIAAINAVIGSMNSMSSDELTKWYTSAMALIGKEASALPGSASSDSNKSSLNMKDSAATGSGGASAPDAMPRLDHKNNPLASMKEDVEEMFVGTDLSEEFKDKATTLFEAAVNARATLEIARLEEEFETAYEQRLEEEVASIVENVETNLDTYLDYIVENWMEDNQVAVESSLRNEIMEEFIGGLKGLFTEHYIDVPEEKVNIIEAMAQKIETLENALNESINDNNELKSELVEARMLSLVDELSEGLTISQAEKFAALAEGVSFDGNFNSYKSKLEMVKETYFSMKPKTSNIEEETFESDDESVNTVNMDPHVSNYVRAIARTTKK